MACSAQQGRLAGKEDEMTTTTMEKVTDAPPLPRFDSPLSRWIELWQLQLVNGSR